MTTKFLEIRDRNTCIPALAFDISAVDGPVARRAGFGYTHCVYLVMLATERAAYDPYSAVWGDARTMRIAHQWLTDHFAEIETGAVLDVRVLLGEATEPARAECV